MALGAGGRRRKPPARRSMRPAARRRMCASPRVALRVRSAARRSSRLSGAGAVARGSDDLVGEVGRGL